MFFRDPFRLVPVNNIADIADKLRRNEILSSNEIRGIIGFEPVENEKADMLVNPNINQSNAEINAETDGTYGAEPYGNATGDIPSISPDELERMDINGLH
jgi:hypothetical protein